jgi:hypothetical protein
LPTNVFYLKPRGKNLPTNVFWLKPRGKSLPTNIFFQAIPTVRKHHISVLNSIGNSARLDVVIVEQKISKDRKISGSFNFLRNYISAYGGVLYFPYERPFSITKSDDNTRYAKINS